jgi:hypothetical protein
MIKQPNSAYFLEIKYYYLHCCHVFWTGSIRLIRKRRLCESYSREIWGIEKRFGGGRPLGSEKVAKAFEDFE